MIEIMLKVALNTMPPLTIHSLT